MDKNEMLNYIIDFSVENDWKNDNVPEQIRALFTAWAFLFHIDADTYDGDNALCIIYFRAALKEIIEWKEFEDFMLKLIV